jgi:hypothetical protein
VHNSRMKSVFTRSFPYRFLNPSSRQPSPSNTPPVVPSKRIGLDEPDLFPASALAIALPMALALAPTRGPVATGMTVMFLTSPDQVPLELVAFHEPEMGKRNGAVATTRFSVTLSAAGAKDVMGNVVDSVYAMGTWFAPTPASASALALALAWAVAAAVAPALAAAAAAAYAVTEASIPEIDSAQGTVKVVICGAGPSCPVFSVLEPGVPSQASTTVVVMGTSGTGVSVQPQCSAVTVVVKHVSVLTGQI